MKHQFKILFYTKKNQPLKNGTHAIICRISVDGESCTFSTHLAVEARLWDNSRKCVRGRSEAAKRTNALLDNIRYALQENYFKILRSNERPTAYMIRNAYIGGEDDSDGVVVFFRRHNLEFEKMVGTIRRPNTLYKYRYVCNHLQKFIYATRGVSDIPLNRVNRDVICEFHNWLATDAKCSVNTIRLYLTALKHIIMLAIACGRINQNPFLGYQLRSEPSRRHFLLKEELRRMMLVSARNDKERIILDAFIFGCFTGLAYSDISGLTRRDIIIDEQQWAIATRRNKTHTSVEVPLLKIPQKILQRYMDEANDEHIFTLPTNCWCNRVIKDMAQRANINKRITFHTARHTFATTVTLSYGVPIEAVSRMLGHTDIKTTQIYAKILESVVNSEMQRVSDRINIYFQDY